MGTMKVIDLTLASSTTNSDSIDIGINPVYEKVAVQIPTFASGGTTYVLGSTDNTTFYQMSYKSATQNVFQIAKPGGAIYPVPEPVPRYLKVANTTQITNAGHVFTFILS